MKKFISLVLVVISIISVLGVVGLAVESRWNNSASATIGFNISSTGKASVTYNCVGVSGITTSISAETKLERKWGVFWLDVDGAEWVDSTKDNFLTKTHEIQLNKTGTYRATVKLTVSGSGGSDDAIKLTSEKEY